MFECVFECVCVCVFNFSPHLLLYLFLTLKVLLLSEPLLEINTDRASLQNGFKKKIVSTNFSHMSEKKINNLQVLMLASCGAASPARSGDMQQLDVVGLFGVIGHLRLQCCFY